MRAYPQCEVYVRHFKYTSMYYIIFARQTQYSNRVSLYILLFKYSCPRNITRYTNVIQKKKKKTERHRFALWQFYVVWYTRPPRRPVDSVIIFSHLQYSLSSSIAGTPYSYLIRCNDVIYKYNVITSRQRLKYIFFFRGVVLIIYF